MRIPLKLWQQKQHMDVEEVDLAVGVVVIIIIEEDARGVIHPSTEESATSDRHQETFIDVVR